MTADADTWEDGGPRKVRIDYFGMTDCKHRPPGYTWVEEPCPCGRVYVRAYIDCSLHGRMKATSCRMLCGDYCKRPLEDK